MRARHKVRTLSAEDALSANVTPFMSGDSPAGCLCAAALSVACVEPAGPGGPPLEEPRHLDGGASICHMGITLYGSRTLRCEQPAGSDAAGAEGKCARKLVRHAVRGRRLAC